MDSLLNPGQYARRLFFLNAGCAHEAQGSVDRAYVERMHNLLDGMPPGVKLVLFAFERAYDEDGAARPRDAQHVLRAGRVRARRREEAIPSASNGSRRSIRTRRMRSSALAQGEARRARAA